MPQMTMPFVCGATSAPGQPWLERKEESSFPSEVQSGSHKWIPPPPFMPHDWTRSRHFDLNNQSFPDALDTPSCHCEKQSNAWNESISAILW